MAKKLRDRPESAGRREAAGEAPAESDAAALARAYLDLWERHLVHAAVRSRFAPARAPRGPGAPPRA